MEFGKRQKRSTSQASRATQLCAVLDVRKTPRKIYVIMWRSTVPQAYWETPVASLKEIVRKEPRKLSEFCHDALTWGFSMQLTSMYACRLLGARERAQQGVTVH